MHNATETAHTLQRCDIIDRVAVGDGAGRPPWRARNREDTEAFFLESLSAWRTAMGIDKMILVHSFTPHPPLPHVSASCCLRTVFGPLLTPRSRRLSVGPGGQGVECKQEVDVAALPHL